MYATSDQDVHGLGIHLSNLGPTNRVDQNKKEEEENGCVQAVHYFITLSGALWCSGNASDSRSIGTGFDPH